MMQRLLIKTFIRTIIFATLIFIPAIFALTAQGSQDKKAAPIRTPIVLDRVILQLKWFHQFQFAGYYAALDKGFYQAEGMDVVIRQGGPKIKVDQVVTRGEANFGVLGSELIRMRIQGEPVVLLATIMQHSIRALIIRADAGIFSPADLAGHPMILNQNEAAEFMAMFISEGIPLEKLQIIDKDKTALDKLINGKITAMNGSIANQPFVLKKRGIPVRLIRPISYGTDFYGDSLFTSDQEIRKHPEQVAAFRRASLRGWEYAMQHPEEIIDLILVKYNSQKSRAHLVFEADTLKSLILPTLVDIGHVNPNRIARTADVLATLKIIPPDYSLEGFVYDPGHGKISIKLQKLILISAGLCFLFAVCGTILLLFNKKLKKTVKHRTSELTAINEKLRQALEEKRESETHLNRVFKAADNVAFITTDINGQKTKVLGFSPGAEKIFGYTAKEIIGRDVALLHPPDAAEDFPAMQQALGKGEKGYAGETTLVRKSGKRFPALFTLHPLSDNSGTLIGTLGVSLDITDQKQIEKELEEHRTHLEELVAKRTEELKENSDKIEESRKALTYLLEDVNESRKKPQIVNMEYAAANKELKEFAYIVSHDLKAPLRAISQLTHWISEDYSHLFNDEGKEQMELIIKRARRMDGLIDGILRYSRIGRVREKEERLDLNLLLNEVIENIVVPDHIQIVVENRLPMVVRDSIRMEQVFQNLIGNAIKFMDKDEGIITVACMDEGTSWKFSISDNGPGINQRYHEKIFQIFQTLTARDEHESTGIGLTLVKKIIGLYGGTVWVKSESGHGATFFFTLPKKGRNV